MVEENEGDKEIDRERELGVTVGAEEDVEGVVAFDDEDRALRFGDVFGSLRPAAGGNCMSGLDEAIVLYRRGSLRAIIM